MYQGQNKGEANTRKTIRTCSPAYVRGASDQVDCVLKKFRVQTAFKPVRTLGHVFRTLKDRPAVKRIAGIVYKVKCHDWSLIQAVRATAKQQVNSMLSQWNMTSIQRAPRLSSVV